MQKLFRLLCAFFVALSLLTGFAPEAAAKKSRSSSKKSVKSKKSSGGKVGRSSRKGRSRKISRRRGSSRRRDTTIATQQANQERALSGESGSQEDNAQAVPRAVAGGIPQDRVMEIQSALSKSGYYTGDVNGVYDETTKQAMKQFQQANSLSASGMPSAHALKKLGVSKRSNASAATPIKKASDGGTQD